MFYYNLFFFSFLMFFFILFSFLQIYNVYYKITTCITNNTTVIQYYLQNYSMYYKFTKNIYKKLNLKINSRYFK